jgi:myo-inositol-1-phosphate synthase
VGNIASMFVQSVMLSKFRGFIEGVMTENIGGYGVGDIEFVAALTCLGERLVRI